MNENPSEASTGAIILCGGESRRMGRDKAWLPFGRDATLLERMVRLIGDQVGGGQIVVVAAPLQKLPALPSHVQVARDRHPDEGPLMGVATGLSALNPAARWALVCCCDLPLMKSGVLTLLGATARQVDPNEECDAVVPRVEEMWQPLTAVYRTRLLPHVNDLLRRGKRRMTDLLEAIIVRELRADELNRVDSTFSSFRHCNTPEDYASLLTLSGD